MDKIVLNNTIKYVYARNLNVRIDDVNWAAHLDGAQLVRMLHQVRLMFLADCQLTEDNCCGSGLIMKSLSVDYKSQAKFNDELQFKIGFQYPSEYILIVDYDINNLTENRKLATAKVDMCFFDYKTQMITTASPQFISFLKNLQPIDQN